MALSFQIASNVAISIYDDYYYTPVENDPPGAAIAIQKDSVSPHNPSFNE